jgi:hypothetical protein
MSTKEGEGGEDRGLEGRKVSFKKGVGKHGGKRPAWEKAQNPT